MLKKKFCKKCWKKSWHPPLPGIHEYNEHGWEEQGEICCPSRHVTKDESMFRDISDKPPKKCPFFLEHTV